MGLDFVAISFETANSNLGSACAVGLARIRNGKLVAQWSTFVNYPRSLGGFDSFNTDLHGITPKDLIGAPLWHEVLPKVTNFIANDYVVAHNASYDMDVFAEACHEAGSPLPNLSYFCTRNLSKAAVPRLPKYRFADMVEALKLGNFGTHDTEANAMIAALICVKLADREELKSLTHLMGQYGIREGKMGLGRGYYIGSETAVIVEPDAPAQEAPVAPVEAHVAVVEEVPVVKVTRREKAAQPVPAAATESNEPPLLTVKGQRISFVGGFDLADRTAAKEKIAEQGGKYLKNVRPDTTLLVIGTHHNPNLEGIVVAKAFNERGSKIRMMNKDEFFGVLGL